MADSDEDPKVNPMEMWRDWYVQNERNWSEAMTGMMKKDEVSQALGKEINAAVYGQQMMSQGLAGPMAMMNMATRDDVLALGDRIGQLEDAVARIEAALTTNAKAAPEKPARTRKAPGKDKT